MGWKYDLCLLRRYIIYNEAACLFWIIFDKLSYLANGYDRHLQLLVYHMALEDFNTTVDKKNYSATIGWCATFICPLLMLLLVHNSSMALINIDFLIFFTAALVLWIFRLVPESIPAIMIILSIVCVDSGQYPIMLSGFRSDSFFITLILFGIGCVLSKSRFFYRCSLLILYYLPPRYSLLQKMLFVLGALMTPFISVQSSRIALMAPLLDDILVTSRIGAGTDTANGLASAAFNGCILLSTIFLTGKSSNSILYAMLSEKNQQQFSWFKWLFAASFTGILLTMLFFVLQLLFFKKNNNLKINKFRLRKDMNTLGKFSFHEKMGLLSMLVLMLGLMLSSWLRISLIGPCLLTFMLLWVTGSLTRQEIRNDINWSFLFYLGSIIGIMRYAQHTGLDLWFMKHLEWLVHLIDGNIHLFIIYIYIISWLCGFILGTMTAPVILFTLFLPLAQQLQVNSWLLSFVILTATEAWVFPYQSTYYLCFESLLNKQNNFHLKPLLKLNAWWVIIKLCILLASFPFWRWLGIM